MFRQLPLLRPLADPALALLWGGLATSAFGDQLFAVVLTWVAVGLFGAAAGYLTAMQAAVTLATALLAGSWADRIEHRRLMVGADIARAAALMVVVTAWLAAGAPAAWSLIGCVLVLATGQALFRPVLQATLPGLVRDAALLPATNALLDSTERIARLLGPGLIGALSAIIPLVHFVTIDAATFLVSAGAILAIRRLRPDLPAAPRRPTRLLQGFAAVHRHGLLGFMLGATAVINGTWYATFFLAVPLMLSRADGHDANGLATYGLVISAYGLTNLLSMLVIGNRPVPRRPGRLIFTGNACLGIGILLLGLIFAGAPTSWYFPGSLAAAALVAIGGPMHDITMATLRQTLLTPADMAPAVRAYMVMSQLGLLIALTAAPMLFDALGVGPALVLCAAGVLAFSAYGLLRHAGPIAATTADP